MVLDIDSEIAGMNIDSILPVRIDAEKLALARLVETDLSHLVQIDELGIFAVVTVRRAIGSI